MSRVRPPREVPTLTDGTVTLRALDRGDLDAICEQCRDPDSVAFTTIPSPYTRRDAEKFVDSVADSWAVDSGWCFAISIDGGVGRGGFAGSISASNRGGGVGDIGFLTHPALRGRGVMSAAVRLFLDWAFDDLALSTVTWHCVAGNIGSWRVAWRNGFTFEGSTRAGLVQRDVPVPAWHASLVSSDSRAPKTRWLPAPRLEAANVVLREVVGSDEERFLQAVHDPVTAHWFHDVPMPRDSAGFRRLVRDGKLSASLGQSVAWSLADPNDDRYVGSLDLFGLTRLDHSSAEAGYRLHPDARGRGILTSALRLAIDHAFAPAPAGGLGLNRVHLGIGAGNVASQAVARSLGFTETGRDRQVYLVADGTIGDLLRLDLLRSEYQRW